MFGAPYWMSRDHYTVSRFNLPFVYKMALNVLARIAPMTLRVTSSPLSSSSRLKVNHDRPNRRFTVTPGGGSGLHECAVLQYRFTGDREVDLMSTYVPEAFRSRGVAALLSQAAMEFLLEENLKARVSCCH
ncbi:protein NATD1-like isoform X2 [Betta splendens]|uniref:Protein NATD1 n=1 Tax=Betta splendens TaxID=158456 RepID=A0A6P7N7J6_BETSP|nr:protein NATD1-like isoform X2 [Betta splendens]